MAKSKTKKKKINWRVQRKQLAFSYLKEVTDKFKFLSFLKSPLDKLEKRLDIIILLSYYRQALQVITDEYLKLDKDIQLYKSRFKVLSEEMMVPELDTLLKEKEKLLKEVKDLKTMYLRLKQDFENYRKRSLDKISELEKKGSLRFIEKFLPVLDNLQRSVISMDYVKSEEAKNILIGIDYIITQVNDLLMEEGIKEIEAKGKEFDPKYHEAFEVVDNKDVKENTVVEVVRKGYITIDGKVIRPALVKVAKS